MNKVITFFVFIGLFQTLPANAQQNDAESIDTIITTLYDVISGPADQERDWDRFRSLFAPGAQLIPIRVTRDTTHAVFNSVESYIERANPYFINNGFFEVEIARRTERFGTILHAFSTYESYNKQDDTAPFARGINSIQLMHDGNRWWIINIMWDAERPGLVIPNTYLPN